VPINEKLLRKVQQHILEEPKRFMMDDVIFKGEPGEDIYDGGLCWGLPSCGTAACIGGWTLLLSKNSGADLSKAQKLLGLNEQQEETLFYVENWPGRFIKSWRKAKTPTARARVASKRIDQFLEVWLEEERLIKRLKVLNEKEDLDLPMLL
jgi:hypothetical protein